MCTLDDSFQVVITNAHEFVIKDKLQWIPNSLKMIAQLEQNDYYVRYITK